MKMRNKKWSRRIASVASVSLLAGAPFVTGAQASSSSPVTVNIAHTKASVTGILVNAVMEQGFDVKNGVKLNPIEVAAAPAILAGFAGGSISLTSATIDNFITWQMAIPMTAWREQVSAPFWEIIVRKEFADANIKKNATYKEVMKALETSNVGIVAKGGASDFMWQQLVGGAGVTWTGAAIAGAVSAATVQAQLIAKSVDAVIAYEPFATMMVKNGLAVSPFSIRDGAVGLPDVARAPGLSLGGPTSWFVNNRDTVKKIDKAFDEGIAWLRAPKNFPKAVELLQKNSGLDNPTSIELLKQNLNYFSPNGSMNLAAWDRVGQWYVDNKIPVVKSQLLQAKDFVFNLSAREIKPMKVGSSMESKTLATQLQLYPKSNSTIKVSIQTKKNCTIKATAVVMTKAGTCEVGIQVVDKGSKKFANRSAKTIITVKK